MASFKDHKVTAAELLGVISEALMSHLSAHTGVDYYTKVLHGKKMFYLLMYGILENGRLSQRTLEDTFNDAIFKMLFGLDEDERIRHNSLSERLGKIGTDYFRQIYECVYQQFSGSYSYAERERYNLIRVDSTLVDDLSCRMADGFNQTRNTNKSVKYSVAFDGLLPCGSMLFTEPKYGSEDIAFPEVVRHHVGGDSEHANIYVLDRGLQSARNMRDFSREKITFIVRSKENRKYVELESLLGDDTDRDLCSLNLVRDLISLNPNGIQVVMYMTLITAMLVLIYKRANNIGYKTAKRRFAMGIRDLAIAMIVVQCDGDPKLFFKT